MESSVLSLPIREQRTASRADAIALPWQLLAVVFASSSVILGVIWDISWHMTIGRDTFWTPAHLAIYIGGAVAGITCGFEVLRRSFFARYEWSDGVTIWRVFNGPLGGWVCIWGAVAMLTSAPFDDWWHNAYGLDVKIISPPHTILALGFIGIVTGALMMAQAVQSRDADRGETASRAPWIVAYMMGLLLTQVAIFTYEYQDRVLMHSGIFYAVLAFAIPFVLLTAASATRLRFPATAAAAVYTLAMCSQVWILPLFAATPKLGPIRQVVTHMVPLDFPLLIIVPAFLIDIVVARMERNGAGRWTRALVAGPLFVAVLLALQWPFANFLMSSASRNWFFRTDNFAYMIPTDWLRPMGKFADEPLASTVRGILIALPLAVLSSRAGIAFGSWLRSVRR